MIFNKCNPAAGIRKLSSFGSLPAASESPVFQVVGLFEFLTFSPNSAKVSVISALNICLGSFNAENAEEDAEFAEKPSQQRAISE